MAQESLRYAWAPPPTTAWSVADVDASRAHPRPEPAMTSSSAVVAWRLHITDMRAERCAALASRGDEGKGLSVRDSGVAPLRLRCTALWSNETAATGTTSELVAGEQARGEPV